MMSVAAASLVLFAAGGLFGSARGTRGQQVQTQGATELAAAPSSKGQEV